jgi:hypothetical protein
MIHPNVTLSSYTISTIPLSLLRLFQSARTRRAPLRPALPPVIEPRGRNVHTPQPPLLCNTFWFETQTLKVIFLDSVMVAGIGCRPYGGILVH